MTNGKKIKKDNRCLSTAGLKSFRLKVKGKILQAEKSSVKLCNERSC